MLLLSVVRKNRHAKIMIKCGKKNWEEDKGNASRDALIATKKKHL